MSRVGDFSFNTAGMNPALVMVMQQQQEQNKQLMELLRNKGVDIQYSDPYFPVFPEMREYSFQLSSIELNPTNLSSFDCVLLATNHDDFDYEMIKEYSQLIIDTRGIFDENADHIIKA
ncbi:MAG: hypothetical protein GY786_25450 [Proteobacteria bacterium]|nr:hypothetical protein [Pseudomonadota bacterium]